MALFDHFWIDPISICLLLWVTYYSPPFQRAWFWKWPNRPSDRWWSVALGHNLWHGPATFDPLQGYPQDRFTAPSSSYDLFRNLSVLTKINCGRFKDRNGKWEHMDEWTRQTCSAYQTPVLVYQLTACTPHTWNLCCCSRYELAVGNCAQWFFAHFDFGSELSHTLCWSTSPTPIAIKVGINITTVLVAK